MQPSHDGYEQPRSQETDHAGYQIDHLRSPSPQLQCTVSSEHIVEAEHRDHRQERPEIKNHQAKRSGSNYDQVRVDEEHAYTSMQSALLRAAYGNEAKGQRHGSEENVDDDVCLMKR